MKKSKTNPKEVPPQTIAQTQSQLNPTQPWWKTQSFWVKIIIIIQLCFIAYQFTPDLSTNGDDARYFLLGKALHDGKGYHQIQHPTLPLEKTYPIVFPGFLALVHVFSQSILWAKIAVAILGALVTLLSFYLFRFYSKNLLIPMVLLTAASATLAQFNSSLMSEVPFLFFSLLCLYLYELSVKNPKNAWLFWLTIFLSLTPMHCRSVGLAFSASWILTNFITKRYRFVFAHIILLGLSNIVFHFFTSWENSYLIQIIQRNTYNPELGYVTPLEMVQRIAENIRLYGTEILERSLMPFPLPEKIQGLRLFTAIVFLIMVFIGWLRSLFGSMKFLAWYAFMYFGILLMWQTQWSSERFVAGILPFLYFFLLYGFEGFIVFIIGKDAKGLKARFVGCIQQDKKLLISNQVFLWLATAFIVIVNILFQINILHKQNLALGPDWKNYYSCADWIRENTPPQTVTMSRKVELFYIRSGRTGVMYPYSHDVNNILNVIDSSKVEYIIYDNFAWTGTTRQYLYPVIQSFPQRFELVYGLDNPPTAIYKVVR